MKKVIIIGAGIAGLTAAVYAQLSGFETHIYEMHSLPGGECTAWERKGFAFDGCIHWLVGSKSGTDINRIWTDTGALDPSVNILNYNKFVKAQHGDSVAVIYTDADKLEKHLTEVSPEDKKEIRMLCKHIRAMKGFDMPVKKPIDMMGLKDGLGYALKNIKNLIIMKRYDRMTVPEFAGRFSHPAIKQAFLSMMVPHPLSSTAILFTLASMNNSDSGYPEGGSLGFAKRMADKFCAIGGKLHLNASAEKILIENGCAVGISTADGNTQSADFIISCADGFETLKNLLGNQYTPKAMESLYCRPDIYKSPTCSLVFAGIDGTLPEDVHVLSFALNEPEIIGSRKRDYVQIIDYKNKGLKALNGKSAVCFFFEEDFDFWSELYKNNEEYKKAKQKLKDKCLELLIKHYPVLKGKIEASDVVTPMTYVRYCNAWRGSWMSWGFGKNLYRYNSGELPGLKNFIMAGIWTLPPGGLPCAAASGKFAVQRICRQNNTPFYGERI